VNRVSSGAVAQLTLGGELCPRCAPVLTSFRRLRVLVLGALALAILGGLAGDYVGGATIAAAAAGAPAFGFVVLLVRLARWDRRTSRDILGERLIEKMSAGLPETGGAVSWREVRVFWGRARNPIRIGELGRFGR
jgi:hypothetical protein